MQTPAQLNCFSKDWKIFHPLDEKKAFNYFVLSSVPDLALVCFWIVLKQVGYQAVRVPVKSKEEAVLPEFYHWLVLSVLCLVHRFLLTSLAPGAHLHAVLHIEASISYL